MSFFDSSNINKVGSIVSKDAPLPDPVIPESVPNETVMRSPPSIAPSPKLPTGSIGEMGASEPSNKPINNTNSMKEEVIFIAVSEITRDDDSFGFREQLVMEMCKKLTDVFKEYKEAKERGENPDYPLPPIVILEVDNKKVLACGYHRYEAALKAGIDRIQVKVFKGTKEEAIWFAMRDNSNHGSRLKKGDLKLCIPKALKLFPDENPAVIAEKLGCSRSYSYEIAAELSATGQLETKEMRKGRDSKKYPTQKRKPEKKQQGVDAQEDMPQPTKPDKDSGQIGVNNYYDCKVLCDKGTFDGRKLHRETLELEAAVDGLSLVDTLFSFC